MNIIQVKSITKLKSGKKKFSINFIKNGKEYIRRFGAFGMSDFTTHKDESRRERYISRHRKDLRTNDPMRPGYLSMYILWNKPTIKASLADYKRRLNIFNKTGNFPRKITGSKILNNFGSKIPDNVVNKKLYSEIKTDIKKSIKGRRWGAYDSGKLVRKYKSEGGKYSSRSKKKLSRWYKEEWIDACSWPKIKPCGNSSKKVTYCRPRFRVNKKSPKTIKELSKTQIKSRCNKKKKNPMNIIRFGNPIRDIFYKI